MSRTSYRDLLRLPGVPGLYVLALFARIPHAMSGIVLTLHVVGPLHRGYAEAGIATAAATVGIAVGGPWRGLLVDRFGLRRAVLPSLVVESTVWLVAPLLSYPLLIVAAFVGGLFLVPAFALPRQALAVLVPPPSRAAAFALDSVGAELTFMLAPMVGVLLATRFGTGVALVTVGAATAVAATGLIWTNPPTRSAEPDDPAVAAADASSWRPGADLVVVLMAGLAAAVVLMGTDVSIVATLKEGGRTGDVGWVMAIWAGGSMVGGLVHGARGRSPSPLLLVGILAVATAPLAFVRGPVLLAVAVFVAGLPCAPALSTINARLVAAVPEARRGEVMGWSGTVQTVGNAAGAPVIGWVIDSLHPGAGFLVAAGLGAVVTVAGTLALRVLAGRRATRRPEPVSSPGR